MSTVVAVQEFNMPLGAQAAAEEYVDKMVRRGWALVDGDKLLPSLTTLGGVRVRMKRDVPDASPPESGSLTPVERWCVDMVVLLMIERDIRTALEEPARLAEEVRQNMVETLHRRERRRIAGYAMASIREEKPEDEGTASPTIPAGVTVARAPR